MFVKTKQLGLAKKKKGGANIVGDKQNLQSCKCVNSTSEIHTRVYLASKLNSALVYLP